jgi:hypothetical protein
VTQYSTAYETWVRRLRAWTADISTPLDDLPPLALESLPPATWDRFIQHLKKDLGRVMQDWANLLGQRLGAARSDVERSGALLDARRLAARRLMIAKHPGLPQQLRDALWDMLADTIRGVQDQLEAAATRRDGRDLDNLGASQRLALHRGNSLATILDPTFPLEGFAQGRHEVSLPAEDAVAETGKTRLGRRGGAGNDRTASGNGRGADTTNPATGPPAADPSGLPPGLAPPRTRRIPRL